MTNKEIKINMRSWYKSYLETGDETYFKIKESFRTLNAAFLISENQWRMICKYEVELICKYGTRQNPKNLYI